MSSSLSSILFSEAICPLAFCASTHLQLVRAIRGVIFCHPRVLGGPEFAEPTRCVVKTSPLPCPSSLDHGITYEQTWSMRASSAVLISRVSSIDPPSIKPIGRSF